MVRTGLKKSRRGCQRCKERKVKCDENQPQCSACLRHGTTCQYTDPPPRKAIKTTDEPSKSPSDANSELLLMHQWTSHTCMTFSKTWQYWCYFVPQAGIKHRHVLDATFALAALHMTKTSSSKMPNSQLMESDSPEVQNMAALNNAFPTIEERSKNMHQLAEAYWFTAHQAHVRHMADLVFGDSQVLLTTALLLSNFALFSLDNRESDLLLRWLYLGSDIQVLHQFYHRSIREGRCVTFAKAIKQLDDKQEPYEKLNPFINLLKFDAENEDIAEQDMSAYKSAIDFVAQTFTMMTFGRAEPIEIAQRLMLFPALIPRRFADLVKERRPRAEAILAHFFANLVMLSTDVPWLKGVAETQIARIAQQLPEKWQPRLGWPNMLLDQKINSLPNREAISHDGSVPHILTRLDL